MALALIAGRVYLFGEEGGYRLDTSVCRKTGLQAVNRVAGPEMWQEEEPSNGGDPHFCSFNFFERKTPTRDALAFVKIWVREEGSDFQSIEEAAGQTWFAPASRPVEVKGLGEQAARVTRYGGTYQSLAVRDRNAVLTLTVTAPSVGEVQDLERAVMEDARALLAALEN